MATKNAGDDGRKEKPESLTIFLAKEGISEPSHLLKSLSGLKAYPIKDADGDLGTLFIQTRSSHVPRWADFFVSQVDAKEFGRVASAAAVMVVPLDDRTVILAFGQGRHLVEVSNVEDRFGRRVSLNSVGEDKVRSLDKQNFETAGRHTRIQSTTEARPTDLGIDVDQDFLRTLAGAPKDGQLGKTLTGVDSLHAMVPVELGSLRPLLVQYVAQFEKDSYKKTFPYVDYITDVVDHKLTEELEEALLKQIRNQEFDRCWLAVPQPIDWSTVLGFRYRRGRKQPIRHDITFPTFLETVDDVDTLNVQILQRRDVRCVSADDIDLYTWPVYKCIYCEVDLDGATYLLNGGRWYEVEKDFVKQVDDAVKRIPKYNGELPEFNDDSEGAYCVRVATASGGALALMDKKLITIDASPSKVEFCDLFSTDRALIHVKRYGGSAVLSHLFAQGTVSGQLFVSDANFRKAANALLPKSHKIGDSAPRPDTSQYTVVFAIVSQQAGAGLTLPFFSRLNLRKAARDLASYGYNVAIAKISVSGNYANTKVYRSKT